MPFHSSSLSCLLRCRWCCWREAERKIMKDHLTSRRVSVWHILLACRWQILSTVSRCNLSTRRETIRRLPLVSPGWTVSRRTCIPVNRHDWTKYDEVAGGSIWLFLFCMVISDELLTDIRSIWGWRSQRRTRLILIAHNKTLTSTSVSLLRVLSDVRGGTSSLQLHPAETVSVLPKHKVQMLRSRCCNTRYEETGAVNQSAGNVGENTPPPSLGPFNRAGWQTDRCSNTVCILPLWGGCCAFKKDLAWRRLEASCATGGRRDRGQVLHNKAKEAEREEREHQGSAGQRWTALLGER